MNEYEALCERLRALTEGVPHRVANLANAAALLYNSLEDVSWAGFYIADCGALMLGPFQGKVACVMIRKGHGVCGTAWAEDTMQLVPDVHAFPGHIACDSDSRSEIVVPIHRSGEVAAVLDIDSPLLSRFTEDDAAGLKALVSSLEKIIM